MNPSKDEFVLAASEARRAGAAAWVFHTAAGFDLRGSNTFFASLDSVEVSIVDALGHAVGSGGDGGGGSKK